MTYQQMVFRICPWMTQQIGEILLGCSIFLLVLLLFIPIDDEQ